MKEITSEKIDRYISITDKSIGGVKAIDKKGDEVLDMASRYLSDAKHYREKGDFVTSFGSVNFAHGWLDAGVRLGLLEAKEEVKEFFTIDQQI